MKLGIALGGGGAKGFAHIGVLKTLVEAGYDFDIVTGTSIGALVGAVYASSNLDKLEEITTKFKLLDIPLLLSPTISRQGLFSGRKIEDLLKELISEYRTEKLQKSFAAVCVDLNKPEIVTIQSGDLVKAVRASIAIPGIFTPIINENQLLVDGGVLEPVPVEAARQLGADFVVAVDLLSKSNNYKNIKESNIVDIIQKTSIASQRSLTRFRMNIFPPDILIEPEVADVGILDFKQGSKIVKEGEKATKKVLPQLAKLLSLK
jgi:NTE family protein